MAKPITRMPIIKPLAFLAPNGNIELCKNLDKKLQKIATRVSSASKGETIDRIMAFWLQKEFQGDITSEFNWSRLATMSRAKPR